MKCLILGQLVARHQPPFRPLDHLAVFERASQVTRLAEPGDGQVENRGQLGRAEGLEQVAHYTSGARPIDKLLPGVTREEYDRAARVDHGPRRVYAVAVRKADREDGHVRGRPPHEGESVDAADSLADHR